ncbi:MAG: hypothetical protein PHV17_08980 [Candidatus Omnitrophica bacterium]|nr:hypothetical protein [Candidatus Omnitrophota bacterium]
MLYIIASTGRAGSTSVARLVFDSLSQKGMPIIKTDDEFFLHNNGVVKTHLHFKQEFDFSYRALYLYCDIGDCLSSLARMPYGFLKFHLTNLEVSKEHLKIFLKILRLPLPKKIKKFFAFYYIIKGDKLRFQENIESWQKSKNTLFVKLEDLVLNPKKVVSDLSKHLGLALGDFQIKKRRWRRKDLPFPLRRLIDKTYSIKDI